MNIALRKFVLYSAASIAALGGAGVANAQDGGSSSPATNAEDATGEGIVVTARRKDESIQDAPLAISAFSSAQIRAGGIKDIRNLSGVVPGLTVIDAGGNGGGGRSFGQIYIRPLPPTLPLPRTQTGALFVDGIYVLGAASSIDTSDVERIEVVKGPQSAVFGRNTFGGAINFITRRPGDEFAASADAQGSTRDSYRLTASVEGPLIANVLAARLTGTLYQKGAQYRANDGGQLGEESSRSLALTVSITPTPGLSIRLRGDYQRDNDGPSQETFLRGNLYGDRCPGRTFGASKNDGSPTSYTGFSVNYFCGTLPTINSLGSGVVSQSTSATPPYLATIGIPNKVLELLAGEAPELTGSPLYIAKLMKNAPNISALGFRREMIRLAFDTKYELDSGITFGVLAGYNDTQQIQGYDPDHADTQNEWAVQPTHYKDWSVEGRISSASDQRLRWMVGASYSNLEWLQQGYAYQPRSFVTQAVPRVAVVGSSGGEDATVKGVFGSAEFDVFKNLTLIAEGRYQSDKSDVAPYLKLQGLKPAPFYTFKNFLPRGIIRYKPNRDTTLYASYSVGVLPGQGNAQFLAATPYQQTQIQAIYPAVTEVTPAQKVYNYEGGIKQSLFGGAFDYSLSAYYMQWKNIFASGVVSVPTSATNSTLTVFNSVYIPGAANLWGLEFDSNLRITPKLTGRLTANWQDNKYKTIFATSITFAQGNVRFDGNHIPRIPNVTSALNLTYRDTLTGDWEWYVRGDARYVGKSYADEANVLKTNDYVRVNARIGFDKGDMTFELFANNLLNDKNWDFAFRSTSLAEPGVRFGAAPYQSGVIARAPDRQEFGLRVGVKY